MADKNRLPQDALSSEANIKLVDFSAQSRIVKEKIPALSLIYERLVRLSSASTHDFIQKEVDIKFEGLSMCQFSEFTEQQNAHSSFQILNMQPLKGECLLAFEPELIFTLVDFYYGGTGEHENQMRERAFTPIESRLIEILLDRLMVDLKSAWLPILDIDLKRVESKVGTCSIQRCLPSETMVIGQFHMKINQRGGLFYIVMPVSMLEPIKNALYSHAELPANKETKAWQDVMCQNLLNVSVPFSAELTQTKVSLGDVLGMKTGDIIPIDLPEYIHLSAKNIPAFTAKYGVSEGKCALKIVQRIER